MSKMKGRSEDESQLSNSAIELENSFIARMQYCAVRVGSVTALAREANISQSGIRRYFEGGDPSRKHLIAIALAAKVGLEWLATGEGNSGSTPSLGRPDIDLDRLEEVVLKSLRTFSSMGRKLTPESQSRIIRLVYEFSMKQEKPMDDASLSNVIELAVCR